MRIQHNVTAMNSYRNFSTNNSSLAKNLEKLSSGYKINRAGDDAAGLAISEKMRAQISGLEGATKNAKDGISLVQTAEGALTEVHDMLNRMYTLAEQSANGTYEDGVDRAQLQKEVDQLRTEIDRIADSANFNGLKLLDGSLGAVAEDSLSISEADSVDYSDGITVTDAKGVGAKSTFELTIDQAFSDGDKITLNFQVPQEGGGSMNHSLTLTHTSAAIASYANTDLTFTGVTAEEQINSIVERLTKGTATSAAAGNDLDLKDNNATPAALSLTQIFGGAAIADGTDNTLFSVAADGNKLTITAKTEAEKNTLHLANAVVANTDPTAKMTTTAAGASTTGTVAANGVAGLMKGNLNLQAGDKLKFEFLLADGLTTASATVEMTEDMLATDDSETIVNQIANKLKDTNFDDVATTKGVDESRYKVSDFIDVRANKKLSDGTTDEVGTLYLTAKNADLMVADNAFNLSDIKLSKQGSTYQTIDSAVGTTLTKTANATTGGTAGVKTITFTNNMAEGDTFTMNGTLADGREFKLELTATDSTANAAKNEFAIGTDLTTANTGTLDHIVSTITGGAATVQVKDGDEWVSMKASDAFSGSGMNVAHAAGASTITITNSNKAVWGKLGVTGDISNVDLTTTAASVTAEQTVDGVDKDGAKITLDFNKEDMEYGTSVTIGSGKAAKTFELVSSDSAAVTTEGNIRVVVGDLENTSQAKIVDAFRDTINNELVNNYDADNNAPDATGTNGTYKQWAIDLGLAPSGSLTTQYHATNANYLAKVEGNTITLTTKETGSDVEAIGAKNPGGVSEGYKLDYLSDESGNLKLSAGDTIKVNGNTYQFDTTTRNLQGDNKLIKVSDFSDKAAIAEAIKLAVEEEDASVSVHINEDNSVTLGAASVDGKYTKPTVEQNMSGGGLTLQIGDTSEEFNKLKLNIRDMHTDSIGTYTAGDTEMKLTEGKSIKDIDISSQEGAAEALDVIKNAINMVSDVRGTLGASQNRLEHTINNLGVMRENIQNAESAIRDTDVAEEMMTYTKNNILVQSAQAMLAQANQLPQGVLQLLG